MNKKYFFERLTSAQVPKIDGLQEEKLLLILDSWLENANNSTLDIINYELLIYYDMKYSENDKIKEKITQLKQFIADNYYKKQQLLTRIVKHDDFEKFTEEVF